MATWWNSQQGKGEYTLQFGTDNREKYRLVEKAAQMAIDGKTVDDVEERKYGEWEWHTEQHGDPMYGVDEDFGYRCSECHMWADEWGVDNDVYEEPPTRLHYCPNCGAKMDGGKEEK